ncbi:MAG: cytochrome c [Myxococcota bacterium]
MRFGAWLMVSFVAVGCGGGDTTDTTDTGTTGVDTDTDTDPSTTSTGDERVQTILALTGDVAAGKVLYEADADGCAACHLEDGSGNGPFPALTERLLTVTRERSVQVTLDGTPVVAGGVNMPAYATSYTNKQVADVVAYMYDAFVP